MRRTFIAVKIPATVKLIELLKLLRVDMREDRIRWVNPEILHITLSFIGDTTEEQVNYISEQLEEIGSGYSSIELHFKELGVFRNIRKPRVFWIGMERNELLENLQGEIEVMLRDYGINCENKPFSPHLTIARIKRIDDIDNLKYWLKKYRGKTIQKTKIGEVIYYESKLTSNGPIYNSIKKFPLEKTR
ncbi:MAG: RNA 2',3'-cyclic phosphodiesterase [Bacteroidales bacterium]|nr:RNA 2',3'-cyclic phosphodiesterase [Bacteroidales bacterium]